MILAALCLASNIYFEARGEPIDGQILVGEVTLNRGGDICETVFEDGEFSWTSEEGLYIDDTEAFVDAFIVASDLIANGCVLCSEATYYHTKAVKPYWAKHMKKLGSYGNHTFYKENL